jgi:hypothetical protein
VRVCAKCKGASHGAQEVRTLYAYPDRCTAVHVEHKEKKKHQLTGGYESGAWSHYEYLLGHS